MLYTHAVRKHTWHTQSRVAYGRAQPGKRCALKCSAVHSMLSLRTDTETRCLCRLLKEQEKEAAEAAEAPAEDPGSKEVPAGTADPPMHQVGDGVVPPPAKSKERALDADSELAKKLATETNRVRHLEEILEATQAKLNIAEEALASTNAGAQQQHEEELAELKQQHADAMGMKDTTIDNLLQEREEDTAQMEALTKEIEDMREANKELESKLAQAESDTEVGSAVQAKLDEAKLKEAKQELNEMKEELQQMELSRDSALKSCQELRDQLASAKEQAETQSKTQVADLQRQLEQQVADAQELDAKWKSILEKTQAEHEGACAERQAQHEDTLFASFLSP